MSWKLRTLGELIEPFSVRAKDYGGAIGLIFFGVSNEDGITKSKYAAEGKAEDYKIIEKGCFAYNPYRINVGSIAYLAEADKGLISPAYVVFKPKDKTVEPELLLKFLKSSEGIRQIKLHARGTVRQALRFEDLCKIEINLPDYKEQRSLITRLSSIQEKSDTVLKELLKQQDLLGQLHQSFLREAMQGKLVKQDPKDGNAKDLLKKIKAEKAKLGRQEKELPLLKPEEIPFDIPNNWAWCRLGEVVEMTRGRFSIRPRNDPSYFNGSHPFIQIGSLDVHGSIITEAPQSLNEKGFKVSKQFPAGTIAIAIVGGTIGNLGVLGKPMCFTDSIVGILPSKNYNQEYILNFLRHIQPEIKKAAYQMAGQPNIKIPTLAGLPIPIPPASEQARIISKLNKLMSDSNELVRSIHAARDLNELLLQQVLREALAR